MRRRHRFPCRRCRWRPGGGPPPLCDPVSRETVGLLLGFIGVVLFGGSLPFTPAGAREPRSLVRDGGPGGPRRASRRGRLARPAPARSEWADAREAGPDLAVSCGRLSGIHGPCHAERRRLARRGSSRASCLWRPPSPGSLLPARGRRPGSGSPPSPARPWSSPSPCAREPGIFRPATSSSPGR
jgi:hypothetical protein